MTIDQLIDKANNGPWVPACGGTETPFFDGAHAYLDCGADLILSDEEASAALAK